MFFRESISQHILTIMVQDQGSPSQVAFTRAVINVEDHNDHRPEFLENQIHGTIHESAALGTSVMEVRAIDRDKGQNADITYSIVSGEKDYP